MEYLTIKPITSFPVSAILPELRAALAANPTCLLVAPPGAGKTTLVPPALLNEPWLAGKKIIMLEPRRIATRRSAEYIAKGFAERCGKTVGYRIKMESVVGPETRIEVVTEGILTRMLQTDAELPEAGILIFDEYHERSIHADTGLAFALDVQKNLRPDLRILIMSATPDKQKLHELLGDIPCIESEGRLFPVHTYYLQHRSEKRLEQKTTEAIGRALQKESGDILVFLPGKAEIKRTHALLLDTLHGNDICIHELHGSASSAEQDAALLPAPGNMRKIILATSIAETSLTIEGVRIVIDSGVSRIPEYNPRRGMTGLVTVPVSRATAEQRKGRAGRLQEGVCFRLWTKEEEQLHPPHTLPEIVTADLTPLALELAQWGTPTGEGLLFPDTPPKENLASAIKTLYMLGALDAKGKLTNRGRAISRLPVHPRIAAMLVSASAINLGNEACFLAAILEESDTRKSNNSFDIQDEFEHVLAGNGKENNRLFDHAHKLQKLCRVTARPLQSISSGTLLAIAFPERIAKKQRGNQYQLAQGMTVVIPDDSRLINEEFLVVTEVDAAGATGKAFRAAAISKEFILENFSSVCTQEESILWQEDAVRGKQRTKLGALTIHEKEFVPTHEQAAACITEIVKEKGLSFLSPTDETIQFIERAEWLRNNLLKEAEQPGQPWPIVTGDGLVSSTTIWLTPFLHGVRRKKDLEQLSLSTMIASLFTYEQLQLLDKLAPEYFNSPGGSRIPIRYNEGLKPVIAIRLQELFGQTETPSVGNGRIPLLIHLLSPAHRPLAITQDLLSFWKNTYPDIVKQMRSKYPKHIWPDNPLLAIPTNKTKRAFNQK